MISIALVHYPTVNKEGRTVTTSVTNFDIHDISRAARTYGIIKYFIITPVELQQQFTRRIMNHWIEGSGGLYNPTRKEALEGVVIASDLAEAGDALYRKYQRQPIWVVTSAKKYPDTISCNQMKYILEEDPGQPVCLVFGTGYGLHPQIIELADHILEPIRGLDGWNHLSVRSAVSIYLDRLISPGETDLD
jgi:hypothetical protein